MILNISRANDFLYTCQGLSLIVSSTQKICILYYKKIKYMNVISVFILQNIMKLLYKSFSVLV